MTWGLWSTSLGDHPLASGSSLIGFQRWFVYSLQRKDREKKTLTFPIWLSKNMTTSNQPWKCSMFKTTCQNKCVLWKRRKTNTVLSLKLTQRASVSQIKIRIMFRNLMLHHCEAVFLFLFFFFCAFYRRPLCSKQCHPAWDWIKTLLTSGQFSFPLILMRNETIHKNSLYNSEIKDHGSSY